MNSWSRCYLSTLLVIIILLFDRITKIKALTLWATELTITPYFSLELTLNRGISWGLGNSQDPWLFVFLSTGVLLITIGLAVYARHRLIAGYSIFGELLVISGSVSNIIDRYLYGGVVDFIHLHAFGYAFPSFNIADAAIVSGVCLMFLQLQKQS